MTTFGDDLRCLFGDRARADVPLAPLTTFHVGGPADWLVETRSEEEVVEALKLSHAAGIAVTLLGGGSNVLVSDAGVRGLVIRPRGGVVSRLDETRIRAEAAVSLNGLVRWTILQGCGGLEAWAGTPGTVGGAIFGNAHFAGRTIGEHVTEVRLAAREGATVDVPADRLAFAYDSSRLQETGEVLLSAVFRVASGDPAELRAAARQSLAFRKRTQPLDRRSAGCVFQNPDPTRDRVPEGIPWSAGALIDRAGLKGAAVGAARVSEVHGNFIVTEGTARAADIRELVERCRETVRERFGVELRHEIVFLGDFTQH
jgi:UDP-N-acetylmuramate dehydrogenase